MAYSIMLTIFVALTGRGVWPILLVHHLAHSWPRQSFRCEQHVYT